MMWAALLIAIQSTISDLHNKSRRNLDRQQNMHTTCNLISSLASVNGNSTNSEIFEDRDAFFTETAPLICEDTAQFEPKENKEMVGRLVGNHGHGARSERFNKHKLFLSKKKKKTRHTQMVAEKANTGT
jgi:hypothetical protein